MDLVEETANLIRADKLFAANVAIIKTSNEMDETLIDLLA